MIRFRIMIWHFRAKWEPVRIAIKFMQIAQTYLR
jgi:hypothetical protein